MSVTVSWESTRRLTDTQNQHSRKGLGSGGCSAHDAPSEHVAWDRVPRPDFTGEHDAGYDEYTKWDQEDRKHDGVAFFWEVEIGFGSVQCSQMRGSGRCDSLNMPSLLALEMFDRSSELKM